MNITHYRHTNPDAVAPTVDPQPGIYYVSVKDGTRLGLLAGPYRQHADALNMVGRARACAENRDGRAVFYAFGTVRMKDGFMPRAGTLNAELGLTSGPDGFVTDKPARMPLRMPFTKKKRISPRN